MVNFTPSGSNYDPCKIAMTLQAIIASNIRPQGQSLTEIWPGSRSASTRLVYVNKVNLACVDVAYHLTSLEFNEFSLNHGLRFGWTL